MSTDLDPQIPEVGPREAWERLSADAGCVLVDVRTDAEWGFVGGPDLSGLGKDVCRVQWKTWPGMSPNPDFVGEVMEAVPEGASELLFICRSGARSLGAAKAVAQALANQEERVRCVNVAEGFEGDLDARSQRGGLNGWKAQGLAWCQS